MTSLPPRAARLAALKRLKEQDTDLDREIDAGGRFGSASRIGSGVEVKTSTIKGAGRGLFAGKQFHAGDFITEYPGEVIDLPEWLERCKNGKFSYSAALSPTLVIDAVACSARVGLAAACFANHCPERVNAHLHVTSSQIPVKLSRRPGVKTELRLWAMASQEIAQGQEILVDYKWAPEYTAAFLG